MKKIYTDFYHRLVEAVSDEHTRQSLLTVLISCSGTLSEKKIAQLSSSKVTGSSFLNTLGLEEQPRLLAPLVFAMTQVEQLQTLSEEMAAQLNQGTTCTHMHGSILIECFSFFVYSCDHCIVLV